MKNNKKSNWKAKQDIADYFYGSADISIPHLMDRVDIDSDYQKVSLQRPISIPAKHTILWGDKL